MKFNQDIKSISYVKSHAADIIAKINCTHRPVIITQGGEAKGVLIDFMSYERMNEAISCLKILSQSEKNIENGNLSSADAVFKRLAAKIKAFKS